MPALWVVGDVQGYRAPFEQVLRANGLLSASGSWTGGDATLVVVGDLVDRGPDGIGVIDLLMRLQAERAQVEVTLGNHDVLLLAAYRFGASAQASSGRTFHAEWLEGGGVPTDLMGLTPRHVGWLAHLPAMAVHADVLLQHADALFYSEYGASVAEVNAHVRQVLDTDDAQAWNLLLDRFGEHRAFIGADGCAALDRFLATYGARRLVHGHTPIARMLQVPAESVNSAYVYCDGKCVNVDPGMYLGGPGFAYSPHSRDTAP